ncbi:hypothetical protein OG735_04675 [Streptomyces sp. NBC_01210]|uniref:hypothetical protein n=1 Tax=Streptomyces sp. NBC_01210 TaxID=2903774 RepID=UPI002E11528F|nr:hypothetical protein OG735_04675 [Streptomyces sp. NBC_01210]
MARSTPSRAGRRAGRRAAHGRRDRQELHRRYGEGGVARTLGRLDEHPAEQSAERQAA